MRIGATTSVADVERDAGHRRALHRRSPQAAAAVGSPQLREMGTVGGNLCQQVRCWYFRHPDLQCWLRGGDTCYAQIGDHRKHGLEPGDCISVAPSDLAAALLAMDAQVETTPGGCRLPTSTGVRPADERSTLTLEPGEFVTAVEVPRAPDASAYVIAGERAAWSFALVGVAAARFGDDVRMAAIGVSNLPRPIDPSDPTAGLPGLDMTRWKRRLLETLASDCAHRSRAVSGPIPDYVEARLRRPPPDGCNVIPGSTPVVGFGDPRNAKVATIGLNPNRLEFLDPEASLLREDDQRLETLLSVGANTLANVDAQVLARVFEGCNWYFERRPYRRWFDVLERVLNGIGVSYYRGTACHLTLVQWATNPTWGLLPESSRVELLRADAPFLRQRIASERIELVLLNGRGVVAAFTDTVGCHLVDDDPPIADSQTQTHFMTGATDEGTRIVAWTTNLHAAVGVSEWHRAGITERVAALAAVTESGSEA